MLSAIFRACHSNNGKSNHHHHRFKLRNNVDVGGSSDSSTEIAHISLVKSEFNFRQEISVYIVAEDFSQADLALLQFLSVLPLASKSITEI